MEKGDSVVNCGCGIILLVFNFFIGGVCVNYLLGIFLGRTIPFVAAGFIGLVAGEVAVPVAVVVWILSSFGVL